MKSIHGLWSCSAYSRCSVFHRRRSFRYSRPSRPRWLRPARRCARRARAPRRRCESASMPAAASSSAGVARTRHGADRQLDHDRVRLLLGQGVEHRVADAALGPMILDGHDRAGLTCRFADRLRVDGLDGIEVDDPRRDPLARQGLGGRDRLVERDAGADQGHRVAIGLPNHPRLRRCGIAHPADRGSASSRGWCA